MSFIPVIFKLGNSVGCHLRINFVFDVSPKTAEIKTDKPDNSCYNITVKSNKLNL